MAKPVTIDAHVATEPPEVLTVPELATLLRVERKTVYALIQAQEIPGVHHLGRVIRIPSPDGDGVARRRRHHEAPTPMSWKKVHRVCQDAWHRGSRARAEAEIARHEAALFPIDALRELFGLVVAMREAAAAEGMSEADLERFDDILTELDAALLAGAPAARDVAEAAHRVSEATRRADAAIGQLAELMRDDPEED